MRVSANSRQVVSGLPNACYDAVRAVHTQPGQPAPPLREIGQHVECVAYSAGGGCRPVPLGAHLASSPCMAVVWLAWRAGHIADQLSPAVAGPVRAWMDDGREHARAIACLSRGEAYALVIADGPVRYVLTAAPGTGGEGALCHAA